MIYCDHKFDGETVNIYPVYSKNTTKDLEIIGYKNVPVCIKCRMEIESSSEEIIYQPKIK